MRLDRYLQKVTGCGKSEARLMIASGEVQVGETVIRDNLYEVSKLDDVAIKGVKHGEYVTARYIMLHKPAGCVSATSDPEHQTVVDLIDSAFAQSLHLAGRLDKESTGLVILTNDGLWSRRITEPAEAVPKKYLVQTEASITRETTRLFSEGFYFAYEDITTLPAGLELLDDRLALVTIYEGKYHQIKRMFHAVGNRVTALHRVAVGDLELGELGLAEYRELSAAEIALF